MAVIEPEITKPIAHMMLDLSSRQAERVESIVGWMGDKLASVMRQPNPGCAGECEANKEWPPLFQEERANLDRISISLAQIEDMLQRLEL